MKTTTLCFLIKENQVLLSEKKQGFGKGFLNGYGGKVQERESPELAAVRELYEEANVVSIESDLEKLAVIDFWDGDDHISTCHIYFISIWKGEVQESDEMAYPEWYDKDKLPIERMWLSDREWFPIIFSGKKIKGNAHYTKGMDEMDRFVYEELR